MKTLKVIVTNTAIQGVGKLVTATSTFLIARMISRELGLEGFGQYSIVLAYSAYFYILTDFGLNAVAAKHITEQEKRLNDYFSNLLTLRLVGSLVLILFGLIILSFLPYTDSVKTGIIIGALTILAQAVFVNCNMIFQVKLRFDQSVISSISGAAVTLILSYLSLNIGWGLLGLVLSLVLGYITMAITAIYFAHKYTPVRLQIDLKLWKRLLTLAWPLSLTIIFNLAYFKADSFILSVVSLDPSLNLTNEQAIGLYSMAYKIFEVLLVFPIFFVNVLYPLMLKERAQNYLAFRQLVTRSILGLFSVSLMVSLALYLLSPTLINLASNNNREFLPSVEVLRVLGFFLPLFFLTNILLWTIMTLGKQKVLAIFYAFSAVINISLNIWLIPRYGYMAAALTTGLTEATTLVMLGITVWLSLYAKKENIKVAENL